MPQYRKIFVTTGDLKSINEGNFMDKETTEYDVKHTISTESG